MNRVVAWLPIALVVAVAAGGFAWWLVDDGESVPEPIDLVATEAEFASIVELAAASDLIVRGEVVGESAGRTLTDPAQPDAGIVTGLAQLRVVEAVGDVPDDIVVEQEVALLDGTSVTVNGAAPLAVGDDGIAFLVDGARADQPFSALISTQAWIPVVDGVLQPRIGSPFAAWAGRAPSELFDALDGG